MTSTRLWRPVVLVQWRVCVGCSVSRAHKTWSPSFLLKDFHVWIACVAGACSKGMAKGNFGCVRSAKDALLLSPSRGFAPKFLALPFLIPPTLPASLWKAIITSVPLRHYYPFKAFSHIPMTEVWQCGLQAKCENTNDLLQRFASDVHFFSSCAFTFDFVKRQAISQVHIHFSLPQPDYNDLY